MINEDSDKLMEKYGKIIPVIFLWALLIISGISNTLIWGLLTPLIVVACFVMAGKKNISITMLDFSLLLVCAGEITVLFCSNNFPNRLEIMEYTAAIVLLWFFMRICITGQTSSEIIIKIISVVSLIVSVLTITAYLKHKSFFSQIGITDMTVVRQYYHPLDFISNDWIGVLVCLLPFPVYSFLGSRRIVLKIFHLISFVLVNISVLVSFSRGGYLSLCCFYLIVIGATVMFHFKMFKQTVIVLFLSLFISVCALIPDRESVLTTIAMNKTTVQKRSSDGRLTKWKEAIDLFKSKPYAGYGSGNYVMASNYYGNRDFDSLSLRSTNSYLQILVEKGLIGSICYLFAMIVILYAGVIMAKKSSFSILFLSAFVALIVHEFFFSSFFENKILPFLVITIIYFSVSPCRLYEKQ